MGSCAAHAVLLVAMAIMIIDVTQSRYQIPHSVDNERTATFWRKEAKDELDRAIHKNDPIVGVAKNVILFLGDGMGMTTVTAARILAGQMQNQNGEEFELSFDKFPNVALSKTYSVDHQTADSASTATAYLSGVKTGTYTIGITAAATRDNCSTLTEDKKITSILDWSLKAGKSVGVVTTTRVTHATPAGAYAHTVERNWEGSVPEDQEGCVDIATQLIRDNLDINVIMGGGREMFLPVNSSDPELVNGTEGRKDDLNLLEEWKANQTSRNRRWSYIWNLTQFEDLDPQNTDYLLGLFNPSHMQYEIDRKKDLAGEPSLSQMTEKAIQILKKNDKGFFLLVEGGRIDHGHHDGVASRALHDTVAFSEAVGKAADLLSEKDSLIIATADHSHSFAIAGYAGRGNPILGLVAELDGVQNGTDGKPYTSVFYGNGPGAKKDGDTREDLRNVNTSADNYHQQAIVPMTIETHGGEDVAIYARGPMSHLFHGVHQQSYIAHVMAYASCVGNYSAPNDCAASLRTAQPKKASGSKGLTGSWAVVFGAVMVFVVNV